MRVLGISAFYHDSAAALVEDGRIIAAAQEERFSRKKHDSSFPDQAIDYCLDEAGIGLDDLDHVVFYDKPLLKFERLLETYVAFAPAGFRSFRMAIPLWLKEKLFQKTLLRKQFAARVPDFDWQNKLLFAEHHLSHAASAFFPSPFDRAAVLTMDGVGEWATTTVAEGNGNELQITREIHFPHSLGLLYSAFTYYTGFKVNSGEYKVMGLAPYGEPKYASLILDELVDVKADGSFRLNQKYFNYCTGLTMTNGKFDSLFDRPPRAPEAPLESFHMDVAASIQAVTEEVVLRLSRSIAKETGLRNLCLAGGVALNCVANGKIARDGCFDNLWIQPAAGDAGGALGAALSVFYQFQDNARSMVPNGIDAMAGSLLGPSFDQDDIEQRLTAAGAVYSNLDEDAFIDRVATDLSETRAVGWFHGRMEYGPRALGARSIIADPRSPDMQRDLNLKIKYRESFRPFAPAVLEDAAADWFELDRDSPYMLLVSQVAAKQCVAEQGPSGQRFGIDKLNEIRSSIPAVTHVDYSARVQTVHQATNPRFHALLNRFKEITGCPVLVNTSFNVRGEPIVCTPEDAFRCFMGTELDVLAIGNCYLRKEDQNPALKRSYEDEFDLD